MEMQTTLGLTQEVVVAVVQWLLVNQAVTVEMAAVVKQLLLQDLL